MNFSWKKWDFSGGEGTCFVAWTSYYCCCCYLKREEEKCRARRRKHLKVVGLWTGRRGELVGSISFSLYIRYIGVWRIWNSAPLAIYFRFRKDKKKVVFDGNERRKWGNVVGVPKNNTHTHTKEFGQSKLDLGVSSQHFFDRLLHHHLTFDFQVKTTTRIKIRFTFIAERMQTRNPAHESDAISKLDGTPLSRSAWDDVRLSQ